MEDTWQAWAKPLGAQSHAVLLMATGDGSVRASLPLARVAPDLANATAAVCVRDLFAGEELPPLPSGRADLVATLGVHGSSFYCVRPLVARGAGASCATELRGCPDGRN